MFAVGIDVSNGKIRAERNVVVYSLFVTFFPTLLSGPINRAGELLPQFYEEHRWDYRRTVEGLQRFLLGAFKKVVLADGLSLVVNGVWSNLQEYYGLTLLVVMLLYTIQLYCDFAGYSDMAVGAARILGFTVRENFSAPYLACSVTGFWSRWHISLNSWFRDYVYIPLGGNRKGYLRKLINIFIVFVLSGLWHGNTVTFLVWGLLHGAARCLEDIIHTRRSDRGPLLPSPVRWLITQGFVSVAWLFFRAPSLHAAWDFLSRIFVPTGFDFSGIMQRFVYGNAFGGSIVFNFFWYGGFALGTVVLLWSDIHIHRTGTQNPLAALRGRRRWLVYWSMGLFAAAFYLMVSTILGGNVVFLYQGY